MENKKENMKTNTGLLAGLSLAVLSTTCCALPIVLVSIGLGGAVASLMTNVPWLVTLSKYKFWTFSATGIILTYCWYLLYKLERKMIQQGDSCSINDQRILKWQRKAVWISTMLLLASIFAAYALLPIRIWIDQNWG